MIRRCPGWGERPHDPPVIIGEKEPLEDGRVTDGMCFECERILNKELDEREKRRSVIRAIFLIMVAMTCGCSSVRDLVMHRDADAEHAELMARQAVLVAEERKRQEAYRDEQEKYWKEKDAEVARNWSPRDQCVLNLDRQNMFGYDGIEWHAYTMRKCAHESSIPYSKGGK